ncbi:hypothetical protein [Azospirillum largimobile]
MTRGSRAAPDGTFGTLWNGFPALFHCSIRRPQGRAAPVSGRGSGSFARLFRKKDEWTAATAPCLPSAG